MMFWYSICQLCSQSERSSWKLALEHPSTNSLECDLLRMLSHELTPLRAIVFAASKLLASWQQLLKPTVGRSSL